MDIAYTHSSRIRKAFSQSVCLIATLLVAILAPSLLCPVAPIRAESTRPNSSPAQDESTQTKLAEGEYVVIEQSNDGAIGPFPEQIYNFDEAWTLSRDGKDSYKVEGVRKFESPKGELHTDRFTVELSRDFTITRAREFAKLKWVQDSGPLTCDFLPTALSCSSGGSNPQHAITMHTPVSNPYGLLWPVSPFSLSGITFQVERDPTRPTRVDLISIEQPSQTIPVQPTILEGPIRYIGEENIKAAGRAWSAFKFSLKVPLHPEYLIWTSSKGLLLAVAVEHQHANWQQEGMRLDRFQSWNGFLAPAP
jgi:hypothetical protein